jgi:hypothetical protein
MLEYEIQEERTSEESVLIHLSRLYSFNKKVGHL